MDDSYLGYTQLHLNPRGYAMGDFVACIREGRTPLTDAKVGATAGRRMVARKELAVEI